MKENELIQGEVLVDLPEPNLPENIDLREVIVNPTGDLVMGAGFLPVGMMAQEVESPRFVQHQRIDMNDDEADTAYGKAYNVEIAIQPRLPVIGVDRFDIYAVRSKGDLKAYRKRLQKDAKYIDKKVTEEIQNVKYLEQYKSKLTEDSKRVSENIQALQAEIQELERRKLQENDPRVEGELRQKNEEYQKNLKLQKQIDFDLSEEGQQKVRDKWSAYKKTVFLNKIQRQIKGDTDAYLYSKTQFHRGLLDFMPAMNMDPGADLFYKMAVLSREDSDFPIYDMVIDAADQVQEIADFYNEKRPLDQQHEAEIRKRMYRRAVSILEKTDLISATSEKEDRNEELTTQLKVTSGGNDAFFLSTHSARGLMPLKSAAEAQKMGLENNWTTEDLDLLVTFNMLRYEAFSNGLAKGEHLFQYKPDAWKNHPTDENQRDFVNKINDFYDRLSSTPIKSEVERENALEEMHSLIKEAFQGGWIDQDKARAFNQIYKGAAERTKLISEGKEKAFVHTTLIARDAFDEENIPQMGQASLAAQINNESINLRSWVNDKRFIPSEDINTDHQNDPQTLVAQAVSSQDGTKIPIFQMFANNRILDVKKFEKLRSQAAKEIADWEEALDEETPQSQSGLLMNRAIKALSINPLKRAIAGYTEVTVAEKSPIQAGFSSLVAAANPTFKDQSLQSLEKYEKEFPVWDVYIETDAHIQTLTQYWQDQKKNKLTPERQEQYREKLYKQVSELLPKVNTLNKVPKDREKNNELIQAGILSGNQPFFYTKEPSRGTGTLLCSLEAHKAGLEQGWPVDDLGILAAFNTVRFKTRNACLNNGAEDYEKFEVYEPPRYINEAHKKYLDQMDELWNKVSATPLLSDAARIESLSLMQKKILEGKQKGFVSDQHYRDFTNVYHGVEQRNAAIEAGKEKGFYGSVKERNLIDVEFDLKLYNFSAKRSSIFRQESDEHKELRLALEKYRATKKTGEEEGSRDYDAELEILDEVIFRARQYRELKGNPNTPAGKDRLQGAKEFEEYAKEQRRDLVRKINEKNANAIKKGDLVENGNLIEDDNRIENEIGNEQKEKQGLKELRVGLAKRRSDEAVKKINDMLSVPQRADQMVELKGLAADILIGKLATSKVNENVNGFHTMGSQVIKKTLLESKEFNQMVEDCCKEKVATERGSFRTIKPGELAERLQDDNALRRLVKLHKTNAKMEEARTRTKEQRLQRENKIKQRENARFM